MCVPQGGYLIYTGERMGLKERVINNGSECTKSYYNPSRESSDGYCGNDRLTSLVTGTCSLGDTDVTEVVNIM